MSRNQSIEIITLNDGRLIKDLTLTLDSRLTVFTGATGSGKTSLLKALAWCTDRNKFLPWVLTNYNIDYLSNSSEDISDLSDFAIMSTLWGKTGLDTSRSFNSYSRGEQEIVCLYWSIAKDLPSNNDRILVLIDDLGCNLDPILQHEILPSLLSDFPTAQFVITTTSPLVLTHVQPDSLFFVGKKDKKIEVWQATESYGKTFERILEDLQGLETTRTIEVKNCLDRFSQYLDSGNLASAKSELETARDMTGHGFDPDLSRLESRTGIVSRQNEVRPKSNEINYNYTLGK